MRQTTTHTKSPRMRLCAALLALCLFCVPVPSSATTSANGIDSLMLSIVLSEDAVLSPLTLRERDAHNLFSLCYEGLVKLDDSERPTNEGLAERWDAPTGDGSRWRFYLRPGVTFHNGKPLTAQDVCATLDYIFRDVAQYDENGKTTIEQEEDRGVHGNLIAYIRPYSWKAVDDTTLEINSARNYYGFLNAMTFPVLPAEEVGQPMPSGTGPYQIAEYIPGNRIWLTAYADWWKPLANVRNIMAYIYPDTTQALAAFDSGVVSATMTRSLDATRYFGSLNSFSISYRTRQLETLLMYSNDTLGDPNVRRAIALAIDRSALVQQVYQNMATPVSTPIAPGTWLYDEAASADMYNPTRARALLAEAGWIPNAEGVCTKNIAGEPSELSFTLMTYEEPNSSVRRSAAYLIQEMLAVIGVKVTVNVVSRTLVQQRLSAGNFSMVLCGMNMDVVPDFGFLTITGYNSSRFEDDALNKHMREVVRGAVDENAYRQAMADLQRMCIDKVPFISLYYRTGALITRDTFTAVRTPRERELLRGIESW